MEAEVAKISQMQKNTGTSRAMPEHLQALCDECSQNLDEGQREKMLALLMEYSDVFSKSKSDLGKTSLFQHRINTVDAAQIKQRARRIPLSKQTTEKEEVDKMLKNGIISPSNSPWSSPVVLVTKRWLL